MLRDFHCRVFPRSASVPCSTRAEIRAFLLVLVVVVHRFGFRPVTVRASSIFSGDKKSQRALDKAQSLSFCAINHIAIFPSLCQMISRCHRLPLRRTTTAAHLPHHIMSSVVAHPPAPHQPAAESSSTTKAAAFSPDAPQPAFAGPAAAPAGAADPLADDEAAPLRFKGTQPVRRGRTAVPGERADCTLCSDHTHSQRVHCSQSFANPLPATLPPAHTYTHAQALPPPAGARTSSSSSTRS